MSNNLNLSQVAAAQNQKEVTINDQAGQPDAALTEVLTIEVDDSNACVLTDSEFRRHFFIVVTEGSPVPAAAIAVQVPANRRGLFKLLNLTSQTVSIEVPSQSTWNTMSDPGAFAAAGAEEQEGGEPAPLSPAPSGYNARTRLHFICNANHAS
jgi:hypothetical protein